MQYTAWQVLEITLLRSLKSVATTSWTAYKSGKVANKDTDGDHFAIAQSTATLGPGSSRADDEFDINCYFFVAIIVLSPFAQDLFYKPYCPNFLFN